MKLELNRVTFPNHSGKHTSGFALVATLALMILLTMVAVGLLSLSAISLRSSSQGSAQATAQANARLALMIALGELQKEMGPDSRVSAEAALFDNNVQTSTIDGLAQSRWMASYNAWGDWLNASYRPPDIQNPLTIGETYGPRRQQMFRRWLLSLPQNMEKDIAAPNNLASWNNTNSVILVGKGSLGDDADDQPDQVTRGYLTRIGTTGKHAWWIGPENHRAKVNLSVEPRTLAAHEWETSQGDTAEVAVGALPGLRALDEQPTLRNRVLTTATLRPAGITDDTVKGKFFDLTTYGSGVLASVRSGHLKKDLSLLFELSSDKLPTPYKLISNSIREPSIRPMTPDLLSKSPKVTNRHFASWTNMRHYYRMSRSSSDATSVGSPDGIGSSGALKWAGAQPYSEAQICLLYRDKTNAGQWLGENAYHRMPVLAKLTFIYSLMSERVSPGNPADLRYRLYLVYTPVFTYWNPYNTELRIPDNILGCLSSTYQVLPMRTRMYLHNVPQGTAPSGLSTGNAHSFLRSGGSSDIVFKPGEIRLFSHNSIGPQSGGQAKPLDLVPGFNPMAYGGDRLQMGTYTESQRPGVVVQFGHSEWGGNVSYGNTPGSLCHTPFWLADPNQRGLAFNWNYPVMYQNDWFNLAQTYTSMTPPGAGEISRWVFTDSSPVPVAYAQMVIKGMSEFNYESINWGKDWRSRNWIQSPPFYFGNNLYISEDDAIAHTQRVDNPYVMNFGPMSMAEMGKVVGHVGNRAFLGSGANPFEKVTSVPAIELPSAPVGSLAGFSGMRINPGWADPRQMNTNLSIESVGGNNTSKASYAYSIAKMLAYQSGVTGPGIGNSFMHPMLPRTDIYQYFNNSVSADPADRTQPLNNINYNDNKVFCDYWDHVFLLNDALWDDYFVSSLADQSRPAASGASSLSRNLDRLVADEDLSNSRYRFHDGGLAPSAIKSELQAADGYLKAARHLMVDGMFNVNSTSVSAWYSLFVGIRERQLVYRDNSGNLRKIQVPSGKKIAISRFNTEVTDKETDDPEFGVDRDDGTVAWSGVRYLDEGQLMKLAEECVKQVKQRGPFLNFSEFINRRLSNDKLGLIGALQSAIDYDDESPDSASINYRYKNGPDFMLKKMALGGSSFQTPEAAEGSRFAGIPGYIIQSDLLKPISNTLAVRDDTFRIRTYGEALDTGGKVIARAWCEAVVQRMPEYLNPANPAEEPARRLRTDGSFEDNPQLTEVNRRFGRRFHIVDFRWLNSNEV